MLPYLARSGVRHGLAPHTTAFLVRSRGWSSTYAYVCARVYAYILQPSPRPGCASHRSRARRSLGSDHPRHDLPLRALYDALSATSIGKVILDDKNDKDYHKLSFYQSFNATHVPDLIRPGGSDSGKYEVYSSKCPRP